MVCKIAWSITFYVSVTGLPVNVREWTVTHVANFIKCSTQSLKVMKLFESRRVNGVELLLLTHHRLVKEISVNSGQALKIMNLIRGLRRNLGH